ncbi:podoplanin domain-containing protein [Colletotrichum asianum]
MQLCKILSVLSLAIEIAGQTTTCYWPNGIANTVVKPCPTPQGKAAAACCFDNHYCLTNGLCMDPDYDTLYRGACTDSKFEAEGCPKYCDRSEISGADPGRHIGLWGCDIPAVYTCEHPRFCLQANFTIEQPGKIMLNTAVESDLGITATATSSSTPSSSARTEMNNGISAGAAAGIGVGVGVPLAIAVVVLSFLLVRERKKVKAAEAATPMGAYSSPDPKYGPPPPWAPGQHGNAVSPELPTAAHQARHELPQ